MTTANFVENEQCEITVNVGVKEAARNVISTPQSSDWQSSSQTRTNALKDEACQAPEFQTTSSCSNRSRDCSTAPRLEISSTYNYVTEVGCVDASMNGTRVQEQDRSWDAERRYQEAIAHARQREKESAIHNEAAKKIQIARRSQVARRSMTAVNGPSTLAAQKKFKGVGAQ